MKIRRKLLIAFSVYMILALIPAAFSYRELHNLRKRLKPVEIAADITTSYLEMRKNEKSFLLLRDKDSFQLLKKQISMLRGNIDDIESEIRNAIGDKNYTALRTAISLYEADMQRLSDNFAAQRGKITELSDLALQAEKNLPENELQTFQILQRHEKNLIIQRDAASMEAFKRTYASVRGSSSPALRLYAETADNLYTLYQEEKLLVDGTKQVVSDIQTITDSILHGEREDIDHLLSMSMILLLASLAIILIIGAFINTRLAAHIAAPIKEIRKFAEGVAGGDFSQSLVIRDSQEFQSLADALNQMSTRLRDTVNSLELAIRNLHDKQGQLVEAEKLASLGRIAAGVAHEINNPLAIINEKAGLVQDLLSLSSDFEEKQNIAAQIEGIIGSVNRCRSITHRLLGFARRMDITIEPLDLNDAIRETIAFLRSDVFSKSARLDLCLADDLPEIRSDKIQLEQVFLNLIKNAVDAITTGGQITVTTTHKDQNFVQVIISDNGSGIPKDKIRHIFEPFFTTKERGKGTGLGLFVSHAILRKLGCKIQVQSEPEKGTTFVIDIPIRHSAVPQVPA